MTSSLHRSAPRHVVDIRTRRPPRDHTFLDLTPLYDWADERPGRTVGIDRTVARYVLEHLRADTDPDHPVAHADAIVALVHALER